MHKRAEKARRKLKTKMNKSKHNLRQLKTGKYVVLIKLLSFKFLDTTGIVSQTVILEAKLVRNMFLKEAFRGKDVRIKTMSPTKPNRPALNILHDGKHGFAKCLKITKHMSPQMEDKQPHFLKIFLRPQHSKKRCKKNVLDESKMLKLSH